MTVKELKDKLDKFDDDLEVVVQYRDGGGSYSGADKDVFLCMATVVGDGGYDSYDKVYYTNSVESGKGVLVL